MGGASGGAGGGGTAGAGAGGAHAACDVTKPFGTPILVPGLNGSSSADDGTARFSADERTAYFYSDRAGYQIFTATRASRTDTFSTPQPIGGYGITSGAGNEFKFPTLTTDGLTMFFESDPGGTYQVIVATRSDVTASFTTSAPVAGINAGPDDSQPFVLPDGSALYFMSTRNDGSATAGTADIYRAARASSGQFTTPVQVSTINTSAGEYAPVPTPDELVLYYASSRSDGPARGGFDIWMTKRASVNDAFDPPVNVVELNTSINEIPDWISPDRCRLYFDRLGASGTVDKIYVAERAP
jgi:Tol biopolymer transport system component